MVTSSRPTGKRPATGGHQVHHRGAAPGSCRVVTYALGLVEQQVDGRRAAACTRTPSTRMSSRGDVGLGAQLA